MARLTLLRRISGEIEGNRKDFSKMLLAPIPLWSWSPSIVGVRKPLLEKNSLQIGRIGLYIGYDTKVLSTFNILQIDSLGGRKEALCYGFGFLGGFLFARVLGSDFGCINPLNTNADLLAYQWVSVVDVKGDSVPIVVIDVLNASKICRGMSTSIIGRLLRECRAAEYKNRTYKEVPISCF